MKDNVNEIDFQTYLKIYDNFEFAINENEFLFYENQIHEDGAFKDHNRIDLNLKSLTSKYFKKGTFIWICKKIQEIIFAYFFTAYKSYIELFGKNTLALNVFFNSVIDIFEKKVNGIRLDNIDPIFFKEGLISFYYPFEDTLDKIGDEQISKHELIQKIGINNKSLVDSYIKTYFKNFIHKVSNLKASLFRDKYNKDTFKTEVNSGYSKIVAYVMENMSIIKVKSNFNQ